MRVIPIRSSPSPIDDLPPDEGLAFPTLRELLLGDVGPAPLPAPADILSAAIAIADGARQKSILPLGCSPAELVLLRRGADVLVSYYASEETPEISVLDRAVPLRALLDGVAAVATQLGERASDPASRQLSLRLAERYPSDGLLAELSVAAGP